MKSSRYLIIAIAVLACAVMCAHCASLDNTAALDTSKQQVEMLTEPVDDQARIDKILEAYRRLPADEIKRMGLDPNKPVAPGTAEAELLFSTWQRRVEELREVMNSVAKPVSMMEDIILTIKDKDSAFDSLGNMTSEDVSLAVNALLPALQELESLVSDVDNANDFHSIGGWSILSSLLSTKYPTDIRAAAAWVVGTAVKNNYDYQLWVLETFEDVHRNAGQVEVDGDTVPITIMRNASTLQYLIEIVQEGSVDDGVALRQKALYALTAATRGNPDVQQAILAADSDLPLLDVFKKQILELSAVIAGDSGNKVELLRYLLKVWSFLNDLVEERRYVHVELAHNPDLSKDVKEQMLSLKLLGDELVSAQWVKQALDIFESLKIFIASEDVNDIMLSQVEEESAIACASVLNENVQESSDDDNNDSVSSSATESATMRVLENVLGFVDSVLKQTSNVEKSKIKSDLSISHSGSGVTHYKHYRYVLNVVLQKWCKLSSLSMGAVVSLAKDVLDKLAPFGGTRRV